jgi:hypothetical protein
MFQRAFSSRRRSQKCGSSYFKFEALEPKRTLAANFLDFSVVDASLDQTGDTVFESGALSLDYSVDVTSGDLVAVEIFADDGSDVAKIGEFFTADESGSLISLDGFTGLTGMHEIYGVATTSDGQHATSDVVDVDVLPTTAEYGDFLGTDFIYSGSAGSAYVLSASGGTDTLVLNFNQSDVMELNGASIGSYDPDAFVSSQVIYQGSAYDYMTTTDGRELYYQGVERLEFADGSVFQMNTTPNDPQYVEQWDISTGDVGDAWRFTRGSDEILLVSLDTGTATTSDGDPITSDIDLSRTDYIVKDDASVSEGDHGHRATSVMVAEPNNNFGLTGINWVSPTFVIDVYYSPEMYGQRITNAINASLDFLETSSARRIVFQGGIQGEYWLGVTDQSLISDNMDSTLFSVAAGNGSVNIDDATSNPTYSAGVARLAGTYDNVMAIGALEPSFEYVDGIKNVDDLPLAGYSNYGDLMTFAGPSRTRSIGPTGSVANFGGTSNANPVVAAYSSLVWSVNPDMTAVEVRDLMSSTAMDLGVEGRDSQFGWGTPDVGSAVRKAWAQTQNSDLANLEANPFSAGGVDLGYLLATSNKVVENINTKPDAVEIGLLSTTNTDLTSLDYSLVSGTGDNDNATFEIVGDSLRIKQDTVVDYESQSAYSIRIESSDGTNMREQQLTVEVLDEGEFNLVVGEGSVQRSMLNQFVVEFDGIVTLGSTPFEVVQRGDAGGVVDVTSAIDNSSGSSVVTLTFSGAFTEASGSLADGNYQLTIFGDQIQTASGSDYDADGDGVAGGNFLFGDTAADNFFRLLADTDGSRGVDVFDLLRFRQAWQSETGDSNYNPDLDSDLNGAIDVFDLLRMRQNWQKTLDFV